MNWLKQLYNWHVHTYIHTIRYKTLVEQTFGDDDFTLDRNLMDNILAYACITLHPLYVVR